MIVPKWQQFTKSVKPQARSIARGRRLGFRLQLEQLEDRVLPIVGAFAVPPPIPAGTGYDGVVKIIRAKKGDATQYKATILMPKIVLY